MMTLQDKVIDDPLAPLPMPMQSPAKEGAVQLRDVRGAYKDIQIVPLDPSLGDKLADEAKLMRSIFKKR